MSNLLKNRKLAKALSDSALGGLLTKLKSKAETLGVKVVEARSFLLQVKPVATVDIRKKRYR